MKKIRIILTVGCISVVMFAGCGNPMPELTDEQSSIITEYAASLLLKYDKNYDSNLAEIPEENELDMVPESEPSAVPEETEEPKQDAPIEEIPSEEPAEEEVPVTTVQDFYGLEGLEFAYRGYIVTESYSGSEDANSVFAFDASEGKKLVVLEFDVKNVSAQEVAVNMMELNPRFSVRAKEVTHKVQPTMLMNDMTTYSGTLQSGEVICLALVAEFEDDLVKQGDEISLLIRNESTNATILLN